MGREKSLTVLQWFSQFFRSSNEVCAALNSKLHTFEYSEHSLDNLQKLQVLCELLYILIFVSWECMSEQALGGIFLGFGIAVKDKPF